MIKTRVSAVADQEENVRLPVGPHCATSLDYVDLTLIPEGAEVKFLFFFF